MASNPALRGPPPPRPTVATGTSPGICTVDKSESSPPASSVGTGRPITGRVVCEAITPARWAAPPAAAMSTFNPRAPPSWRTGGRFQACGGRYHADLVEDPELVECGGDGLDFRPIAVAAYQDAHQG